jgi:hypothetical protein
MFRRNLLSPCSVYKWRQWQYVPPKRWQPPARRCYNPGGLNLNILRHETNVIHNNMYPFCFHLSKWYKIISWNSTESYSAEPAHVYQDVGCLETWHNCRHVTCFLCKPWHIRWYTVSSFTFVSHGSSSGCGPLHVFDGTLVFSFLEIQPWCPSKCADGIHMRLLLIYQTNNVQIRKHNSAIYSICVSTVLLVGLERFFSF